VTSGTDVCTNGRPIQRGSALEVRARLEAMAQQFIIHFDVDVIDFMDLPLAELPQLNAGLTLGQALTCLKIFVASSSFRGLVITECNPDHADEEHLAIVLFVQGLGEALAERFSI